jgi:hypothetical protein
MASAVSCTEFSVGTVAELIPHGPASDEVAGVSNRTERDESVIQRPSHSGA